MFRVMDFAVEVAAKREGATRFEVRPGKIYPAALVDLRNAVESGRSVDGALLIYYNGAKRMPAEAWELALVPRGQVDESDVATRAVALELTRGWFTELLHRSINGPMELHILKDENWRL